MTGHDRGERKRMLLHRKILIVLAVIGIEPSLIAVILGVDRILDMCRTTLNVVGDAMAATYVARSEGCDLLKHGDPGKQL